MHQLGVPPHIRELWKAAGFEGEYMLMLEVGGRGAYHPKHGWISTAELMKLVEIREGEERVQQIKSEYLGGSG